MEGGVGHGGSLRRLRIGARAALLRLFQITIAGAERRGVTSEFLMRGAGDVAHCPYAGTETNSGEPFQTPLGVL